jgi:hypothetical protein
MIRFIIITLISIIVIGTLFNIGIYWIMYKLLGTNYYITLVMQTCTGMLGGATYYYGLVQYAKVYFAKSEKK